MPIVEEENRLNEREIIRKKKLPSEEEWNSWGNQHINKYPIRFWFFIPSHIFTFNRKHPFKIDCNYCNHSCWLLCEKQEKSADEKNEKCSIYKYIVPFRITNNIELKIISNDWRWNLLLIFIIQQQSFLMPYVI